MNVKLEKDIEEITKKTKYLSDIIMSVQDVVSIKNDEDNKLETPIASLLQLKADCHQIINDDGFKLTMTTLSELRKRLVNLEAYIFENIVGFLKQTAHKNKLDWDISTKSISTVDDINVIIEIFKASVIKKNQSYKTYLEKIKKDYPKNNMLAAKIDALLKTIDRQPDYLITLNDTQEIDRLSKKILTRTIATIEDNTEKDLLSKFNTLVKRHQQYEKQYQSITPNEKWEVIKDNEILKGLSNAYQQKNAAITTMIGVFKTKYENRSTSTLALKDLLAFSELVFDKLSSEIVTCETLVYDINETVKGLFLPSDQKELLIKLQDKLNSFLIEFSTIQIDSKDNSTNHQLLIHFFNELKPLLQVALPDKKSVISALHDTITCCLGVDSGFLARLQLFASSPKPSFGAKEIDDYLKELFSTQDKLLPNQATLKKNIIDINKVIIMLASFSLKPIKEYYANNAIEKKQTTDLEHHYHNINTKIKLLVKELEQRLILFIGQNYGYIIEADNAHNKLKSLKIDITKLYKDYQHEKKILLAIENPNESVSAITTLQEETIKELLEKNNNFIEIENNINQSQLISILDNSYDIQKNVLKEKLIAFYDKIKLALTYRDYKDDIINQEVIEQKKLIDSYNLNHPNKKLAEIFKDVETIESSYKKHASETERFLNDEITTSLTSIEQQLACLRMIKLTKQNPYLLMLQSLLEQIENNAETYKKLYQSYKDDKTNQQVTLETLYNTYYKKIVPDCHEYGCRINKWTNENKSIAEEIERRLQSREYYFSCEILEKIDSRYQDIFTSAIKRNPGLEQDLTTSESSCYSSLKSSLHTLISHHEDNQLDRAKKTLGRIDIQLTKLLDIYVDFNKINCDYTPKKIISEKNPMNMTDEEYVNKLIDKTKEHLQNDHMEDISDSVRSNFIQWIRKKILVPLTKLKKFLQSNASQLISKKTSTHSFFANNRRRSITPGSSETEAMLIKLGNTALVTLENTYPAKR